jgi:hypothetical protein
MSYVKLYFGIYVRNEGGLGATAMSHSTGAAVGAFLIAMIACSARHWGGPRSIFVAGLVFSCT